MNQNQYRILGYTKYKSFFEINYINELNNIIDNLNLKPSNDVFEENNSGKIKQIQYTVTLQALVRCNVGKMLRVLVPMLHAMGTNAARRR